MSLAKAIDVESVRFSAPELATMRAFLSDFGLREAEDGGDGVLRMRGVGPAPFVHETVQGASGFVALCLSVGSMSELEALAASEGAAIERAREPGGGHKVQMRDPDGYLVEAVFGRARTERISIPERPGWNIAGRRGRTGEVKRIATAPAQIVRLGHVVLGTSNMTATWKWWNERFGLIISDEVRAPNGDVAALFVRCDRGAQAVDHHTLNFASIPGVPPRFHHAAFEVLDLDDLMAGNRFLADRGHLHDWGVGRHVLGSQVFDYWKDPWGHRVEHWTDGDVLDANTPTQVTDIPTMLGRQWGPEAPANFAG